MLKRETLALLLLRRDWSLCDDAKALLASTDRGVWMSAAAYIGASGRAEAVPYLIRAMRYDDLQQNDRLSAMLHSLTGLSFGDKFYAWHDWWIASGGERLDLDAVGGVKFFAEPQIRILGSGLYSLESTVRDGVSEPRLLAETNIVSASTGIIFGAHFVCHNLPSKSDHRFDVKFIHETISRGEVITDHCEVYPTNGFPLWIGYTFDSDIDALETRAVRMEFSLNDRIVTGVHFVVDREEVIGARP